MKFHDDRLGFRPVMRKESHLGKIFRYLLSKGSRRGEGPVDVVSHSGRGTRGQEASVKEKSCFSESIRLGSHCIRMSRIIDYGLETEVAYYQKVYERENCTSLFQRLARKNRHVHKGRLIEVPEATMKALKSGICARKVMSCHGVEDVPILSDEEDLVINPKRTYLYVLTMDDSYYKFKSDKVDFDLIAAHNRIRDFLHSM